MNIGQIRQDIDNVLQEIKSLKVLRTKLIEAGLELEIMLFEKLIETEIALLNRLDQRLSAIFEGIYDRTFAILQDLNSFKQTLNNNQSPNNNLDLIADLSLDYSQRTYDFAISYRFGDAPVPYIPDKPSNASFPYIWFEPIAGTRLNDFYLGITADIDYRFQGEVIDFGGEFIESFIDKRTWFEPMLGAKFGLQVSDPIILWLRGDVSGFGLAGETNLSWNLILGMDWWVSPRTSLLLAYRFYEFEYGNGNGRDRNFLDIKFNGPMLGVSYHF